MATLISRENPRILSIQSLEAHHRAHLSFIWKFFFGLSDATAMTTSYTPCSCCIFITILHLLTISCVCIFNYTIFILFCFDHEQPEHTLFKNSCTVGSSKEVRAFLFVQGWQAPLIVHKLLHTIPYQNYRPHTSKMFAKCKGMEEILPEAIMGAVL